MDHKSLFLSILFNQKLESADAIILLSGDGFNRIPESLILFQAGLSDLIVISGGSDDPLYGSFTAIKMKDEILKMGIKEENLLLEDQSKNTRDQAVNVIKIASEKGWNKIILVASHYHQPRAFLTFLKEIKNKDSKIKIINAPVRGLSWFEENPWGVRVALLATEFAKIEKYHKQEDVASFEEGIEYFKWIA